MTETYANQSLLEIAKLIVKQGDAPEPHWDTRLLVRIIQLQDSLLNPRKD